MAESIWVGIGLFGQAFFFMRFLIQWIASEKRGESTIPVLFWYFSIGGSMILLIYSIHRQDPVFILGQSVGSVIYIRNLILIDRKNKALSKQLSETD
jgi:lipid-A-disaccharide synthase-like uncharacterized protein